MDRDFRENFAVDHRTHVDPMTDRAPKPRRLAPRTAARRAPRPAPSVVVELPEPVAVAVRREVRPAPTTTPEPEYDPIGRGEVSYPDATAEQQERARTDLGERISAYLTKGSARVVVTDNLHTMVSIKRGHGVLTFRIHHMFLGAPPAVVRALGRYAQRQDRAAANMLRSFVDANEESIRRQTQPRPVPCDVQGRYHHLQEIFDDLNERYFDGAISARITWGPRTKRRGRRRSIKLGSYTCEDALIRIHPVLDAKDVPTFFVAWIVFHEMLHEIHDMPVVDGRRVYHTRQFRQAEASFEHYAEAVLWERTNLHKLLDR
jgi:hypothetical protein